MPDYSTFSSNPSCDRSDRSTWAAQVADMPGITEISFGSPHLIQRHCTHRLRYEIRLPLPNMQPHHVPHTFYSDDPWRRFWQPLNLCDGPVCCGVLACIPAHCETGRQTAHIRTLLRSPNDGVCEVSGTQAQRVRRFGRSSIRIRLFPLRH